jgi:hypothetical protein
MRTGVSTPQRTVQACMRRTRAWVRAQAAQPCSAITLIACGMRTLSRQLQAVLARFKPKAFSTSAGKQQKGSVLTVF